MAVSQFLPRDARALRLRNEIDVELLAFAERYATNLARWDLLVYFGRNPSARGTAHDIALEIGRRPRIIQKELDDLTYLGILRARENSHGLRYEMARAPKTRQMIMRFAQRHLDRIGQN